MSLTSPFSMKCGETIRRKDLHRRFGGIVQGGVSPSRRAGVIFLFSDPPVGRQFGYEDRQEGEMFLYAGSGQFGDQRLTGLNGSVLKHRAAGRQLHLFRGSKETVRYVGQFELDSHYLER